MQRHGWLGLAAIVLGCAGGGPEVESGIARLEVAETAELTTVTGWDSGGREIARLEIVHGRFEMSGIFAEDRDDPRVVGRRLDVRVLDQSLHWETEGFAPVLGLPAHPENQAALAAFLGDARVKPVLAQWGIGFKGHDRGWRCELEGTHPVECTDQTTCQTLAGGMEPALAPPGTCGRTVAASAAWVVHQRANAGYHWDVDDPDEVAYDQSFIAQCCPPSGTQSAFYAKKACPDSRSCTPETPCMTTCGEVTVPGKCTACPSYPSLGKCAMRVEEAHWKDRDAPGGKTKVYNVCARFAWSCGDGVCDVDETCASCAEDCKTCKDD